MQGLKRNGYCWFPGVIFFVHGSKEQGLTKLLGVGDNSPICLPLAFKICLLPGQVTGIENLPLS